MAEKVDVGTRANKAPSRSGRGWILVAVGLLAAPIAGQWLFISFAGQVLHPNPQAIPSVTHSDPSPEWSGAVDRARLIIRAGLAGQNLPGLSVAVGAEDGIVWAEGFGWSDIKTYVPVTPDTRFRIGTASTVLTSAAAGVLLEKGQLALDDEIQTYVPQFPKKQWTVTLRQLMAHVGGVGTDGGDEGPLFRQRCERPVEALPRFAQNGLLFEPGTQYRHSKYGWILVSAAVEAAADQPFLTFIRQMMLEPLGIGGTKTRPATDPATIYFPGFGYGPLIRYGLHVMRPHNLSCYAGSMAFFSTPSDLVRFGLAVNEGTLLRPATVRLLQTSQQLTSGQETAYGLGWDLDTVTLAGERTPAFGHDGELLGRRVVSLMLFREAGIVVAVMSNISYADTPALALKIAEAFAQPARR